MIDKDISALQTPSPSIASFPLEEEASQDTGELALVVHSLQDAESTADSEELKAVLARSGTTSPAINQLNDSDLLRIKMFADFFEYHLPVSQSTPHARSASYLRAVVDNPPPSPLIRAGMETLCLGSIVKRNNDPNILYAARRSYSRMLQLLQTAIATSWRYVGIHDARELLTSVSLLTHLDHPLVDSSDAADSWATHLEGASQLLATLGPHCLDKATALDRGLARHILTNGNLLALAKRKAWPFMERWYTMPSAGWAESLQIFGRLPELLENTDEALIALPYDDVNLRKILQRLDTMKYFGTMLRYKEDVSPNVSVSDMEMFDLSIEEHRFAVSSRSILKFFAPGDELQTFRSSYKMMFLAILECTILRIWHFAPETVPSQKRLRASETNVFDLALKLSQTLLFYTSSGNVVHGLSYRIFLKLARNIFEQQGTVKELSWCNACLIANKMRLNRIKKTDPPSLCRIEEVIHGIAEAGRYKSAFRPQAFQVNAMRASVRFDD